MTEALERDVEKKAPTSFAERQGRMYYLCLTHSNPAGHISVHVEGATRGTSRTLATPKLQSVRGLCGAIEGGRQQ